MTDINAKIQETIDSNDVVLFMKGSQKLPQCGFSGLVVIVLERLGVSEYKDIDVLRDPELRKEKGVAAA